MPCDRKQSERMQQIPLKPKTENPQMADLWGQEGTRSDQSEHRVYPDLLAQSVGGHQPEGVC
jgi:hypothetical protein